MSVTLYMDEHVNSAVTASLRQRGVDVLTVQEDGLGGEDDSLVLDRALAIGRVLFSQDVDFLIETARRLQFGEPFAGVVFSRQQGVSVGRLVDDLELIAKVYDDVDVINQVIYIPF